MGEDMKAGRIWDAYLTERDKQVFATSGFGARAGFGKRPALLIIDVSYGFAGDKPEPILDSIKRWSNSCGAESWDALVARFDSTRQEVTQFWTAVSGGSDER